MHTGMVEADTVPVPLTDFVDQLGDDIKQGSFTPFLGAGASSLRAEESKLTSRPWSQIMKTLVAITAQLPTNESVSFIRSFALQRLGLSETELNEELPKSAESAGELLARVDPAFTKSGLIQLQVDLILAAVRLTNYFGQRFAQEIPSIHDLPSCSVPFEPTEQEARDAIQQLFKAAETAQDLQKEDARRRESPFLRHYPGVQRTLLLQRIYDKLLTLIVILLGDHRKPYETALSRHMRGRALPVPRRIRNMRNKDSGRLRLDAVQWMSELVWYTLRYWTPCYPTTAELAFELSLRVNQAPPRRGELAQAAQALENQLQSSEVDLAMIMRDLILYCENYQREFPDSALGTKSFYYAIATAMQHQYDLFCKRAKKSGDPLARFRNDTEPSDHWDGGEPTASLIFSTNFDNALDNVFEENDLGYHTVYPTVSGDGKTLVWWFKTTHPKSFMTSVPDLPWDEVIAAGNGRPKASQLIGPVIIKIHGAPCVVKTGGDVKHWLVLSEAGYLQALANATMPPWFHQQLGVGKQSLRSLWFLGYSIADWNVRLRLFEHCFEHCKESNRGFRGAVDREVDVYRTALLLNKDIGVQQWVADLLNLPQSIFDIWEDDDVPKSNKVNVLLETLQRLL